MAADLDELLGLLCLEWGFCVQVTGADLLRQGPLTAETFAQAVTMAEGFEPGSNRVWQDRIAAAFVARYGTTEIGPEDPPPALV